MPCDKCGKGSGKPMPHPSCKEGMEVFERLRKARTTHDREKKGAETFDKWVEAWIEWNGHFQSKRMFTKFKKRLLTKRNKQR